MTTAVNNAATNNQSGRICSLIKRPAATSTVETPKVKASSFINETPTCALVTKVTTQVKSENTNTGVNFFHADAGVNGRFRAAETSRINQAAMPISGAI